MTEPVKLSDLPKACPFCRRYEPDHEPTCITRMEDRYRTLPLHRTEAGYPHCATCDGGGCYDCTDPA